MVRLRCESPAERWLIPAFVFFFGMLYPFRWVDDPAARTAAAAGGCVLLRRAAFAEAGGFAAIRDAVIDDCALARLMKARGADLARPDRPGASRSAPTRASTTSGAWSRAPPTRSSATVRRCWRARSRRSRSCSCRRRCWPCSPEAARRAIGGALAWAAMALAYAPTLRRFGLSPLRAVALPAVAAAYALFTLDSALAERRGRGGMWKGEIDPGGAGPGSDAALNRATAAD